MLVGVDVCDVSDSHVQTERANELSQACTGAVSMAPQGCGSRSEHAAEALAHQVAVAAIEVPPLGVDADETGLEHGFAQQAAVLLAWELQQLSKRRVREAAAP